MKHTFHEIPFPVSEQLKHNIRRPTRIRVLLALMVLSLLVFVSAFAPLLAPFGQVVVVGQPFADVDGTHLLGNDQLGRDMLSRLIFSLRNSVGVALIVAVSSVTLGLFAGIIAMMFGRWVFMGFYVLAHSISALPAMLWVFLYLTFSDYSARSLIVILTIALSARVFRLCSSGIFESSIKKAWKSSVHNSLSYRFKTVLTVFYQEKTMLVAMFGIIFNTAVLLEFSLSFLGMGIQPPLASLGTFFRENATLISFGEYTPFLTIPIAISLVFSVYLLIDCLLRQTERQIVPSIRSYGPVWDIQN